MDPVFYTCKKYPGLGIHNPNGPAIQFRKGHFMANDPSQVKAIEKNEWFNVFIVKLDEVPSYAIPLIPDPSQAVQKKIADGTRKVEPWEAEVPVAGEDADAGDTGVEISKSAFNVLKDAGMTVGAAVAALELEPGDRLTVKMAKGLAAAEDA